MRTVVVGASGMLGSAICRELISRGEEVEGWSGSTAASPDGIEFTQQDFLGYTPPTLTPGVGLVINCAAMTDADRCEKRSSDAWMVNAFVPGLLAARAASVGARFVQISTDAVYDDEGTGRRSEDSPLRPASVYAKTKLEGEGRVLAVDPTALVVRTTMFGWTALRKRPKLAEQVIDALSARRPIGLWGDALFSPLHVGDLAAVLLSLADQDLSGILNVGARDPISKADFGRQVARVFGFDERLVEETSVEDAGLAASRPRNVGLDVARYRKLLGFLDPPTVGDGIMRLFNEAFDGTAVAIRGRETYP